MTTVTFHSPSHVGAPLGGSLIARLLGWFAPVEPIRSRALDEAGRIAEAARVRRLAQSLMADDPRFASDLFAAADRHEIG
jgi:hypothetical protein